MTTPEPVRHPVVQGALDGLSRPLADTEFVVVDLETTGGSPGHAAITEIGAVRTGGRSCGRPAAEFASLVNPGQAIPPHVTALTGISDALVAVAPRIGEVLPRFIEFAAGSVLVAHNAPFDIAFLAAACEQQRLRWPAQPTLDTAALARRVLTTDEVHDCRLATLARFFGVATPPSHRALDDARATADVLHGLLRRLADRGVRTFDALHSFAQPAAADQARMSRLTAAIPRAPGVCLFLAADGRVLHVVKSSDMHARACGYFGAAETRERVREMIDMTVRIMPLSCASTLEAEVAEIRLVAEHQPPYRDPPAPPGDGPGAGPLGADQVAALSDTERVVAGRPRFSGGWDVAWIASGRLTATAILPRGAGRAPAGLAGIATACVAHGGAAADAAARRAETACLLGWLMSPGVRLIEVAGTWCSHVPRRPGGWMAG